MAGNKGGRSSGVGWFALGVALTGAVIAVGAYHGGALTDLLPQPDEPGVARESQPHSVTPDAPVHVEPEVETAKSEPVLARGLAPVEPTVLTDRDRTADELLTLAREANEHGKSTDAYRYATMSLRKKKTQAAYEIKAKAACRLGAKGAARSSVEQLSGKRRREVRRECRKHGVWVGL